MKKIGFLIALLSGVSLATPKIKPTKTKLTKVQIALKAAQKQHEVLQKDIQTLQKDIETVQKNLQTQTQTRQTQESNYAKLQKRLERLQEKVIDGVNQVNDQDYIIQKKLITAHMIRQGFNIYTLSTNPILSAPNVAAYYGALVYDIITDLDQQTQYQEQAYSLKKMTSALRLSQRNLSYMRRRHEKTIKKTQAHLHQTSHKLTHKEKALKDKMARINTLMTQSKTLQDVLKKLTAEKKRQQAQQKASAARLTGKPLNIKWSMPLKGPWKPKFNSHNLNPPFNFGAEITPSGKTSLLAPCDAQVMFVGTFQSYGTIILLEHGQNYTLIARVDKANCAQGQKYLKGEPLGVQSAPVYVELRSGTDPIHPKNWPLKNQK
jgi:septal ring factor EnvC (AmiA/AmiB activator)